MAVYFICGTKATVLYFPPRTMPLVNLESEQVKSNIMMGYEAEGRRTDGDQFCNPNPYFGSKNTGLFVSLL